MSEFRKIKTAVAAQFQSMASGQLFVTDISGSQLWDAYLASFPSGGNLIYKTRTEHDCSCCKSFVRTLGAVVSIVEGSIVSIWDADISDDVYEPVCRAMGQLAKRAAIRDIFSHGERTVGTANSRQLLEDNSVKTWDHFHVNLPPACVSKDTGTKLGEARTNHDLLLRGLESLTVDSVNTVMDLIAQSSLYRGEENAFVLESFLKLKTSFDRLASSQAKDLFVWSHIGQPQSVSRIRNTVIGSLLVDLSDGADIDVAVASFEAKVAPTNYKRPTALVTKAMIEQAKKKIEELNLSTALDRRYAVIEDITVNNILFADRSAKKAMNVFDEISSQVAEKDKSLAKVEEIGIEEFIARVLPRIESLEVMVENRHAANLFSLIAPSDPTALPMFKWANRFSWSYVGEVTDSIKERVKLAGGSITGDLCCRLAWDYDDDLDLHMFEPNGGHIYYPNKRILSGCGGMLDVDANGGDGIRKEPVENIFYADKSRMKDGIYTLKVHNYHRRSSGSGFDAQVEFAGQKHSLSYGKTVRNGETIDIAMIEYRHGEFKIVDSLPSAQATRKIWNINTHTFTGTKVVMLSPNHWDDRAVGNKHYFFILDGCLNEGGARGFYNEFLSPSLEPHRKVLEVVGSRMKTEESDRQLSGVGFSSTQRNSVLCRVKGSITRTVKVNF